MSSRRLFKHSTAADMQIFHQAARYDRSVEFGNRDGTRDASGPHLKRRTCGLVSFYRYCFSARVAPPQLVVVPFRTINKTKTPSASRESSSSTARSSPRKLVLVSFYFSFGSHSVFFSRFAPYKLSALFFCLTAATAERCHCL